MILIVVVAVVAEQLSPSGHVAMSGLVEYYPFVHHDHERDRDRLRRTFVSSFLLTAVSGGVVS